MCSISRIRTTWRPQNLSPIRLVGILLVSFASMGRADEQPCVLEVPVFGPTGSKLDFKITALMGDADSDVNALASPSRGAKFGAVGSRLLFPKPMLGRSVRIKLEDAMHDTVLVKIPLFDCRQRTSARWGFNYGSNADVWAQTVKGRMSGCQFSGDWWIRAMPMFGYPGAVHEGMVQPDGSFSLTASLDGERYVIVFGRNREPVKAIGVNVAAGMTNDIGKVDLSGSCPK